MIIKIYRQQIIKILDEHDCISLKLCGKITLDVSFSNNKESNGEK